MPEAGDRADLVLEALGPGLGADHLQRDGELAEARWAEAQGNLAKAGEIHKRVAEAALARLRELGRGGEGERR